jgi:hypothetical protein
VYDVDVNGRVEKFPVRNHLVECERHSSSGLGDMKILEDIRGSVRGWSTILKAGWS